MENKRNLFFISYLFALKYIQPCGADYCDATLSSESNTGTAPRVFSWETVKPITEFDAKHHKGGGFQGNTPGRCPSLLTL
jgi:hypothetical protein